MQHLFILFLLVANSVVRADDHETKRTVFHPSCAIALMTHVLEVRPNREPVADYFHLTGFADESENNLGLANTYAAAGMRTVIWDYPSHGFTRGNSLNHFGVDDLAQITVELIRARREDPNRPIVLGGWSTGGTVVARMLQKRMLAELQQKVAGAVLIAPGIPVRLTVGRYLFFVEQQTLTSNPDPSVVGRLSLWSPFLQVPFFALDLRSVSKEVQRSHSYLDVPTLVMTAGVKEDLYADTRGVRDWVIDQRDMGSPMYSYDFDGASHALLVEPNGVGERARALATSFASAAVSGNDTLYKAFGAPGMLNLAR